MKKLLWFGNAGDNSSFSRITESVLPNFENFEITLLTRYECPIKDKIKKIVKVGSDTSDMTYDEFLYATGPDTPFNKLEKNMKYIVIQIADLLYKNDFDYFIMCNGIYESNWFMEFISDFSTEVKKNTKIIVWSPIDCIPSAKMISSTIKSDLFLTMTPIMVSEIKTLYPEANVDWVGHGSNLSDNITEDNQKLIKKINKLRNIVWTGRKIEQTDIIILNANNCRNTNRKCIDITIKAFSKLLTICDPKIKENLRLWLHTDTETLSRNKECCTLIHNLSKYIILGNNNIKDNYLSMIYKVCKIGIQTSTGEGWSLTNCEHAMFGSLQVVPDFLATGYHFCDNRGILIPVNKLKILDGCTVGIVNIPDTANALKTACEIILHDNNKYNEIKTKAFNYVSKYNWENITKELENKLSHFL